MSTTLFSPTAKQQAENAVAQAQANIPDPPHPTLQQAGFDWGGIQEFNKRVQAVTDAYQAAHDSLPPAGIAFDVARSSVPPDQYGNLFHPAYATARTAQLVGAVTQHKQQNQDDYFVQRPDGVWQPNTPFYRQFIAPAKPAPEVPQPEFLKQHPMVTMGVLPIPSFNKLNELVHYLNEPSGAPGIGTGVGNPKFGVPGVTQQEEQALQRADQLRKQSVKVTTIKQAQTELNTAMGTNLPVTGVFNQTWTDSLSNWMKTTDYAKKELAYQAQQEGFGSNVTAYERAWHQKDRATKHGLYGWFLSAMPLALFGHGSAWDDLLSVPGYVKGTSSNPLNVGLHGLTRTAGLTLDTVGGTVSQAKADLAAGTSIAYDLAKQNGPLTQKTWDQAMEHARQQLRANPSWIRALGFGQVPVQEKGWLAKVDQATNVAGDLILLRKPSLTGERVAAGDVTKAAASTYLRTASDWAYNDLLKYGQDGIGRAAARLESGQGARALVARTAKQVKSGDITREQFRQHVAELYANGRTAVAGKDVSGPLLNSLRSDRLPSPGPAGRAWKQFKAGVRNFADRYDATQGRLASDRARSFALTLRSQVSHYVPPTLGYMDEILPERVFNFVIRNKLGDDPTALANRLESVVVKAQGTENIPRIQQVERNLQKLYYQKNKLAEAGQEPPFNAVLSTEAPSIFHFPGGGEPELDRGFSAIGGNAAKVNATMNRLAKIHARVILSGLNLFSGLGGFSLFWKHMVGDSLRVEAGGGGIVTGLDREVRAAKAEINQVAAASPELSRMLGAFRERAVKSEANWVLNRGRAFKRDFRTGDVLGKSNYMAAAGGYLRRHLDDPALEAYQSGGDALTQLVLRDRTYRGLWKRLPDTTAEEYAAMVAERYKAIEDALSAQGLTFQDASTFYNKVRGAHADTKLGGWIKDNKLDFDVHSGQVEQIGTFDHLTGWWVGNVIMKPNKLNRGRFAENILARTYADLKQAGWQPADALETAISVSGNLTKYHLLDFANRLQVEQDLRWLSYFATKHRLYWKWVLGTFLRHPGYAAAVADFADTLNQQGGWTLPYTLHGQKWMIPLERLVWVPGREYDETSPIALAVFNFIKSGGNLDQVVKGASGTNGNVIGRSDTATILGTKLLKIELGQSAPTYGYATAGLDKKTAGYVTRALNEYQIEYQHEHGHYDTEANAVKKVLLAQAGEEYWRANLPLPVVPETDRSEEQKLLAEFMQLDDPRARAKFMDSHPGFSDMFGVYDNPKKNLHNRLFFQRWTKALDAYRAARRSLYAEAQQTGHWTTDMEAKRRELNDKLNETRNQLLIDDAQSAGINTHGLVPNGTTVPYGPWGKVVNKDPQFDTTHVLNTLFPKLAGPVADNLIGPLQKQMQAELTQLNDPAYVAKSGYTPEEVKTRRNELIQKLAVFNSYPSDALGKVHDDYQKLVNRYWDGYNQRYNAGQKAPSDERSALDAQFRAWRDDQDHPVKVDGLEFPSPVRMAWAMLDPKTRQQRLSYLASKPLGDLANYELDLLGVRHPPNVSNAVSAIDTALVKFRQDHPGERPDVQSAVKQIDKQAGYHGLYAYYVNTLTEPRVRQFEQTSVYQGMPPDVRSAFDQIANLAIDVSRRIVAGQKNKDGTSTGYRAEWRKAVKEQITPWVNLPDNKPLREYLAPMGPNFLYTLIDQPRVG